MIISILDETRGFENFLNRKILSEETLKLYLIYVEKIVGLMNETGLPLNQDIVDGFLDAYPHVIGRAFLKNYLEWKKIKDLDIPKITGRKEKKEVVTISPEEASLIREKLYKHDDKFGLLFDITISCALRRQEVLNIKVEDIKVKEDDKMFILIKKAKGKKERQVYVPKEIAILIVSYIYMKNLKRTDYIFKSRLMPDKPLNKTVWNKAFSIASLDAVGKKYHPHQLRHTKSTEWYEDGIDIVRIQQRLGHSNIATTRLYINPDEKKELELWSNEDRKDE